jgi:hypothetical protein
MIRSGLAAIVIAALAIVVPVAVAQPSTPDNGDGRYTFHRAEEGYMRLDGKTGQVSMCNRRPAGWQCQAAPDERSALEAEIARLQSDNAALKKEILSRNLPLPNGIRPDTPAAGPDAQRPQSREEAEVNRVVRMFDRVWRRLTEMIASVRRDIMKRI